MILVVEGATNSGKTTLCRNLENYWLQEGHRAILLSKLYDIDPIHIRIKSITNPIDDAIVMDSWTTVLLYLGHLARKVDILAHLIQSGRVDHVIVDRLEPSVLALATISRVDVDVVRALIGRIVEGLPPREGVLLEIELKTMRARAALSPLSRKDAAIGEFWTLYSAALKEAAATFYPSTHSIRVDHQSEQDLLTAVIRSVKL